MRLYFSFPEMTPEQTQNWERLARKGVRLWWFLKSWMAEYMSWYISLTFVGSFQCDLPGFLNKNRRHVFPFGRTEIINLF